MDKEQTDSTLPHLLEAARQAGAEVTDLVNHFYAEDVAVFSQEALATFVAQRVRDAVAAQALEAAKLRGEIAMLRATMESAAYQLTKARIWNGMGWHYNVLHPLHYKPALDRLREVLDSSALYAPIAPPQSIEQTNSTSQHQAETMRAQLQGRT